MTIAKNWTWGVAVCLAGGLCAWSAPGTPAEGGGAPAASGEPAAPARDEVAPVRADAVSATRAGAATGRVEGEVVLAPRLQSHRMRFAFYPDSQAAVAAMRPTKTSTTLSDEFKNVVIYFEPVPALAADAAAGGPARPAVRQEGLSFVPHVLPVVRGTTVEFPNADPVFHNVFSLSHAASFDLGRYPRGEAKSIRFDTPGLVKVFCHIHADMSAVVMVLDNPFFAVPDASGRYHIDGLPPGAYRVTGWHERAHKVTQDVRIEAGRTTTLPFSIPLADEEPHD